MASSVLIRGRRLFASSGRSSTRPGCRGRWGPAFRRLERSPEELGQDRHCRPGMCERVLAHACTRTCTCSHTCSHRHTLTHARTRTHMPSHTCTHGASRQTWERCPENTHFCCDSENAVHSRDLGDVWPQQDGNLRGSSAGAPPGRACALPRAALPSRGSRRGGQPPAAPHTSAPAEESARRPCRRDGGSQGRPRGGVGAPAGHFSSPGAFLPPTSVHVESQGWEVTRATCLSPPAPPPVSDSSVLARPGPGERPSGHPLGRP